MASPADVEAHRDLCSRLQRRLEKAVNEFLFEETGYEPFQAMTIRNYDKSEPYHYQQSWSYQDVPLGVKISVTVRDGE